jgi:hypothetical protein
MYSINNMKKKAANAQKVLQSHINNNNNLFEGLKKALKSFSAGSSVFGVGF